MISIIVAISKNNCIGKDGKLPWHIPEDMKHFKELTIGKVVVMGRKTWESIPDKFRPLPNRKNVIITRQENYEAPESVEVFNSIDDALTNYSSDDVMIIGGAQIYKQAFESADKLYVTHVDREVDKCEAYFPEIDPAIWKETNRENNPDFSFITYERQS
ncbi:MAG: dihydrofolate reductase [Patescibacteria group bacterium]|nr:dihydrofolate reductase [Patescibacteria group bacterium]MBU2509455.1 dihydrofolate reductase [Patescibacteria group bacterium]